ncbi:MAG: hypothetical protein ABH983_05365 [Candidatus Micrarchaeota archaeon]|nr:hypothetical protein [Candidatus Micrarchaeota archaeon]MBU1681898.1 hypothetical protein [Candidatus Micrarchaeota archaeon]
MEISKSLKMIFILLAIILFLSIIPYLLSGNKSSADNAEINDPAPETLPSSPYIWDQLNQNFAEKNCLRIAQDYAVDSSIPAMFITSCKCFANESVELKSYSCTIATLDSSYPVEISCFKSKEICTFESGFETTSLTFDQAKEYLE